jgi:hypothetical protein
VTAFVVPFLRRKVGATDWTQAELAEFYRVEAALIAAGMRVETDRGLTDENDPWFVFLHAEAEQEIIIHFARIGGSYLVSAPSFGAVGTGDDFRTLVRQLLARYDEIAVLRRKGVVDKSSSNRDSKIVPHPATMLWVLVALAFLKSAEARQSEGHHAVVGYDPGLAPPRDSGSDPLSALINFAVQSVIVTWAVGAMASDMHVGSDDKFLSWLAVQSSAAPETTVAFTTAGLSTMNSSNGDHGAPEMGWVDHQGSSGTPMSGIVTMTTSEHLALDLANGQVENVPVVSAHIAIEAAPMVIEQTLPAAQPITEAQAIFVAAEANLTQKGVESLSVVPDAIATILNHAIHPTEDSHDLVSDALVLLTAHTSVATHSDDTAPASTGGNPAAILPLISTTAIPAAALLGHAAANTTPSTIAALGTPAPTPVAAPPVSLDQAEVAAATSAVHEFLASVPQAVTIVNHNNLIVYDPLAVNIDSAHVQALTFDFTDGSHISLVGLPSELTHALTGHS